VVECHKDVSTIGAICRSVIDPIQAADIRSALSHDLASMTSIGQRTRVRLFFAQVPKTISS